MERSDDIFTQVLSGLDDAGILQQVVLIGSWALPIYRAYYDDSPEIPVLRTTDVDFLVNQRPKGEPKADIQSILETMGFETQLSPVDGYCKYVHPEIEVEFLTPEFGRGKDRPIYMDQFGVTALPLRYVSLAIDHTITVPYATMSVRVPEPEAFVLLKLLILPKRSGEAKVAKDIATIEALGRFLLHRSDGQARFASLYQSLPRGWQRTVDRMANIHVPELAEMLQKSKTQDRGCSTAHNPTSAQSRGRKVQSGSPAF